MTYETAGGRYAHLRTLPPGADGVAMEEGEGEALVSYLPFAGSPYAVSFRDWGRVELVFHTLVDAAAFFRRTAESGHTEDVALYRRTPGCFLERGLVDRWTAYDDTDDTTEAS